MWGWALYVSFPSLYVIAVSKDACVANVRDQLGGQGDLNI